MQRDAQWQAGRNRRPYLVHLRETTELVEYLVADTNSVALAPTPSLEAAAAGVSAQSISTTFLGATLADTRAYPPDSMGAVGPSQYIVAVNGRIRSFNKFTGVADGIINADTDAFFNPVMTPPANNNFTSDPRIRYDRLSGRWFIIMIDVPGQSGSLPNRVMIAVSDGSVITSGSGWSFYYFQHDLVSPAGDTGKFADYPTLGIDANALYIGVNIFNTSGLGQFYNSTAFVVRKSSLLGGGPIVVTAFRKLQSGAGTGLYTPQGVDNYDSAATEGYFVGVDGQYYGRLDLRRVSNPGGTPSISDNITITIPINGGTINVPHLGNTGGTAGYLDGLDYRLLAAHIRNGRLWTSANVAVDNTGSPSGTDTRMGVNWYELSGIATGQTPAIVQSGTVFESSASNTTTNRCYWMGTVMVSGQGHAAMGFTVAGANERINAATTGRLKNDAVGTMRTPVLYTSTSSAYNPVDSSGNPIDRWGDYSYTCLDPDDDMTMWTIQEFCNANNSYGVQIAKLLAPPPAQPLACSPAMVPVGASNVSVTLLGLTDGDTGFFDPGIGFSNRLAVAVGGSGVTVNSVNYINSTNITFLVTVSTNATAGSRSVVVTNPDRQSATSSNAILTITGVAVSNHPPVLAAITNRTVMELTLLTFTNTATDPDGNQLTFSLDAGAPTNATINPASGVFEWTPVEDQGPGTNSITVRVTDNGSPNLSATQSFTVVVLESNLPPVLAGISNFTLHAGETLIFTNLATDPDIPLNSLQYTLDPGAPVGAAVNATNGIFVWSTVPADAGTTNSITLRVTDNGLPALSDVKPFVVTIQPQLAIGSISAANGVITLAWNSIAGQSYLLQQNGNLTSTNWTDVTNFVASGSSAVVNLPVNGADQKYYRLVVQP